MMAVMMTLHGGQLCSPSSGIRIRYFASLSVGNRTTAAISAWRPAAHRTNLISIKMNVRAPAVVMGKIFIVAVLSITSERTGGFGCVSARYRATGNDRKIYTRIVHQAGANRP